MYITHRKHLSCGFHAIAIAVLIPSIFIFTLPYKVSPVYFVCQKRKRAYHRKRKTEVEKTRNFITCSSQNEADVRVCAYAK